MALFLVDSGKVVPGLGTDNDGRWRSWWWPLPAIGDRDLIASLLDGHADSTDAISAEGSDEHSDSIEAHAAAAQALAAHVDREMRQRLVGASIALAPRRSGRRTVPHAWLDSLSLTDPTMPSSLDGDKVAAFAARLDEWIATGAASASRAHLCLRVHEPPANTSGTASAQAELWTIELLVRDADDPSMIVPIADVWEGLSLLGAEAIHEVVAQLGKMARIAPELSALLDSAAPTTLPLDTDTLLTFASERVEALADVGIVVLLPSWWTRRARVGLRAKAKTAGPQGVVTESGFGLEQLVSFTWEAALGGRKLTKAELRLLQQAAEAKQQLVRLRGEWVQIDPAEVAALIELAGTRGEALASDLLRAGLGLDSLGSPDNVAIDGVIATGWLGELLDDALHTTIAPVSTPDGFKGTLRPYQQRGVAWLAFLGRLGLGACLADDMGLGKTAQLIATMLADPVPGPTLVISPVSVLGNWERELQRFAPNLTVIAHHGRDRHTDNELPFAQRAAQHDVVLTTYSLIARDIDHLAEVEWARIALDEAQQVKNPGTAQTKAVAQLSAYRRIALTGTPVENRLAELWSLMHILNPGLLGNLTSFTRRFSGPIERDHDEDATALLKRVTGPFILRRLKSDRSIIDDLPDKIEQTERCALTREQATLYQAVVDELLAAVAEADEMTKRGLVLAGISKLKQVCNHPAHFLRDGSALTARSGKLNRVEELLDEIIDVGDKVLCFTQYTEWGDLLVEHLRRRYSTAPLWLHGGVPRARRDEMVTAFNDPDGPPIFMLSLKAGGTGLNLTSASHVVHLDRWWNPAVEDQATDRAYRIGQRRTVHVHKLVSSGTIEERIDEMITNKRALAKRVVGTGEQWVTELSIDDLRDVIALRPQDTDG